MKALLLLHTLLLVSFAELSTLTVDDELVILDGNLSAGNSEDNCVVNDPSFGIKEEEVVEEQEPPPVSGHFNPFQKESLMDYPFEERLVLRPLPRNFLLASFQFNITSDELSIDKGASHFNSYAHNTVFPRSISPILEHTNTRQLHLRFTHGLWDAESWGQLPHNGSKSGGTGVEIWAVLESDSKQAAFAQWISLANSLSGLFCTSVNFIGSDKTSYPVFSFQPSGENSLPLFNENSKLYLVRAALANEPICTENLTPFLKLLPTKGKSGVASLLDGHKVFDSHWHSLSIDIETRCDDTSCKYHMEEFVEMVVHVPNALDRAEKPIPKPVEEHELRCDESKPHDVFECFPLPESADREFELSKLFGRYILGTNLVSRSPSRVCAEVGPNWSALVKVGNTYFSTDDNCFEIKGDELHDLYLQTSDTAQVASSEDVPIYVSRSLTGYGQDGGGLRTVFKNPSNETVSLVYFESLPWFMRLYLSSLKIESEDGLQLDDVITNTFYLPAIDRQRPTHLEYNLKVPPNSTFALSYQFDKALLKYAEYPPDANHGFDIESAVVTVLSPLKYEMRTATLLLSLSTPDFSMPYNVIILTSTIMGLAFGTIFNLMVKKLVTVEEADKSNGSVGSRIIFKFRERIKAIFKKKVPLFDESKKNQ